MSLWYRFLAWLRGDYDAIVAEFDNLIEKLHAHAGYAHGVASQQTVQANDLMAAADKNFASSDKALATASKLSALIGR